MSYAALDVKYLSALPTRKMEPQTLESLYQELVTACQHRDKPTIVRCVTEIRQRLDMSSAQVANSLGLSCQTVIRWQKQKPPYEMTMPNKDALRKLEELIRTDRLEVHLPETLPAAYFKAVAGTKRPSTRYLRFLYDTSRRIQGTELSEETCVALLNDLERSETQ